MTLGGGVYAVCCRRIERRVIVYEVEEVKNRMQSAVSYVLSDLTINDESRDGTR